MGLQHRLVALLDVDSKHPAGYLSQQSTSHVCMGWRSFGNTAILVVVDRLTKTTRMGACKDTPTAEELDWLWAHGLQAMQRVGCSG